MEEEVSYDFSKSTCRENTNAEKYALREKLFGTNDVLPVWVADMDIDTPDFVIDAVKKRLEHPNMGYEEMPHSAFEAQIEWMKQEHNIEFKREEMFYSHSVVASINAAIEAFTDKGDKIIVQTPVYPPFFHGVLEHERKLLKNPLKQTEDGNYTFDIADLRSKIDERTKLLLLSSPHNPVGRVWRKEELEELLEVCLEHNITVFSDEIHCDLVYRPSVHVPFASLGQKARDICVTAIGVGKTFNMAGFAISTVVIPNRELREKFQKVYERIHFAQGSSLSHVAFETAYQEGKEWLEELKAHLVKNYLMLKELCEKYPEHVRLIPVEGTYLAWLDCREMRLKERELRRFFINEAKLGLSAGVSFGREGGGFMRLNFGVSSDKMSLIILRLQNALHRLKG